MPSYKRSNKETKRSEKGLGARVFFKSMRSLASSSFVINTLNALLTARFSVDDLDSQKNSQVHLHFLLLHILFLISKAPSGHSSHCWQGLCNVDGLLLLMADPFCLRLVGIMRLSNLNSQICSGGWEGSCGWSCGPGPVMVA